MSGVSLPSIKIPHPSTRLGDPAMINIRGTSRQGSRGISRPDFGQDIERFSATRPVTADTIPFITKSPRGSPRSEIERPKVVISADRTRPILPIFGNQADYTNKGSPRPATSSSLIGSGRIPLEEIERSLQEKMRSGYFSIKNSFISHDPEGRGNVSRDALLKILCNFLAMPLSLSQFNKLMMRMGFEDKKIISIEEFYAKFRPLKSSGEYPTWLDIHQKEYNKMTATEVHANLKEKVKQRFIDLSSILPNVKADGTGRILKLEFRNVVNQLGLRMDDKEFEKLWLRYDPENAGVIPSEKLIAKLGITMESRGISRSGKRTGTSSSDRSSRKMSPEANHLDRLSEEADIDKFLMKKLRLGARDIYHAFLEVDEDKKGHVNKHQFKKVFKDYGIDVTDDQIDEILTRCGLKQTNQINYSDFLRRFQSRSEEGMMNRILNDPDHSYNTQTKKDDANETGISNIEGKLLDYFHKDFMVLLASFRQFDKANSSTVTPAEFCAVLNRNFGADLNETDLSRQVPDIPYNEEGNVRYMDFIARYDTRERQSLFDVQSVVREPPNFNAPIRTPTSPRLQTTQSSDTRASNSKEGRPLELLFDLIKKTVKDNYQSVQEEFYNLDEYNSKKLKPQMLQSLLQKFGLTLSNIEIKRIWDTFITSQDGGLEFTQFIRHFVFSLKSAAFPNAKLFPPQRGDSDFKIRSKKLNSDHHMLEDSLNSKIVLNYEKLIDQFRRLDSEDTGFIDAEDFKIILHDLCIHMTDNECSHICDKFDLKKNGTVSWKEVLKPYQNRQQLYKYGNGMSDILSQSDKNKNEGKIIAMPKGLSSITQKIRERLSGDWRTLRRAFRKLDQNNDGYLTIPEFKSVLKLCSVVLDEEELFQLSSELDENLEGKIPYKEFLNRAMTAMSTMSYTSSTI